MSQNGVEKNDNGYASGGELREDEYEAGVALSEAIQRGRRNLTALQQKLLRRFAIGVGAHPSRIEPLTTNEVQEAIKSLKK